MNRPGRVLAIRLLVSAAVLCLMPASRARGQGADAADAGAAPRADPVKAYRPAARREFRLPNGLRVLLVEDHRLPMLSARLAIRRGSASLGAEEAGMMDALAELLTEGTRRRTSRQIAEEADAIGGEIAGEARADFLLLRSRALSEHAGRMLDLLRETALEPAFPEEEVGLRRENMREELRMRLAEPGFLASLVFNKKLYGAHPYAVTAPSEASIGRIRRERLIELHRKFFVPELAVLVLAGDVREANIRSLVRRRFDSWPRVRPEPAPAWPPPEPPARRVYTVDRPGSSQTEIRLGSPALTRRDPDYFRLLVLNGVLGGSFASRLTSDIREKRGLAYGINTRIAAHREAGAFVLSTQVRSEATSEALRAILEHLDRIRREPVSEGELSQAKNVLTGRFVRELETLDGVANHFLEAEIHGLPADFLESYVGNIHAVTAEQALAAAKAYIQPERLVIAAVGDLATIEASLQPFAPQAPQRVGREGD